jgi:hypothetical protein
MNEVELPRPDRRRGIDVGPHVHFNDISLFLRSVRLVVTARGQQ